MMPGLIAADDLPLERFYRWERERPQCIFLTQPYGGGKVRDWTWAQAADEVRRMAGYLKAQDWPPGTRVAILSKNCAWWILSDLAIWMAGHVSVPIYPSLRPHSVRQILERSECKACFLGATDNNEMMRSGIPECVQCVCFPTAAVVGDHPVWDAVIAARPPVLESPTRAADDLATIIYTSGTTGVPKGVMHTFGAVSWNAKSLAHLLSLTAEERFFSYLPLAHIVERVGVAAAAVHLGSRIFFSEAVDTVLTDLRRARPTIFLSVPRILLKFQQGVFAKVSPGKLQRLLRLPVLHRYIKRKILHELGLDRVRHAACGAAPLPLELLLWYRNLGLELAEGYGMTETLVTHFPNNGTVRPGYVGCAISGVQTKLGENSELLIRSPMTTVGYFKDPEGTQSAVTEDGFFRTGDVAYIDADGQVKIIGRLKEQFKTSKGNYVAPAPIESKLMAHPAVEACCVMGAGLPSPSAVIVLTDAARKQCSGPLARQALEDSLRVRMEEVNRQLDPHERVAYLAIADGFWTIGEGLMTPTLKLNRTALEGRYQALLDVWEKQKKPIVWELCQ
jgi:long-chain acyl-CoA synthetase